MNAPAVICLFGAAGVSAVLCGVWRRLRPLWALLAALCTAAGVLAGLVAGMTLDELLSTLLVVCAVSMAVLLCGKGDRA